MGRGSMIILNTMWIPLLINTDASAGLAAIVGCTVERPWHLNSKTSPLMVEMSLLTLMAKSEDCFCFSVAYRGLLLFEFYIQGAYVFLTSCRVKVATTHSTENAYTLRGSFV